jgi:uncharacterized protein YcnI
MMLRILSLTALLTVAPLAAAAHVRVFPEADAVQSPACGFATFVVRVPVEKPIATTRIDLMIPRGVVVYAVQPKPGWEYSFTLTRGVISKITWSGGRLNPKEFDEFAFLAATPKAPGTVYWDAWQYYQDGSIVKWTGPPNADTPHSLTMITAAPCKIRGKK